MSICRSVVQCCVLEQHCSKSKFMTISPADFRNAGKYMEARQRQHPAIYQRSEAWTRLLGRAVEMSPAVIQKRVQNKSVIAAEIGELTPEIRVTKIGRSFAVEIFTGAMRLIYSAARAIMASDAGEFRAAQSKIELSIKQVAEKIAALFEMFRVTQIATAQAFPVTEDQAGWADTISCHAESFLLMHELAHIYNEHVEVPWFSFLSRRRSQYELETNADATAATWLVDYVLYPKPGGPQRQMFYAGAEFGLRIRMAMETVGMRFEKTHPTAGDRVAALRSKLRTKGGSRNFYAIANTSLAFDQMWRGVEQILLKQPPKFEVTLEDVLSSMRTLTAEMLRDVDANDLIEFGDVPNEPRIKQVVLAPKEPLKIKILNSARDYMREVRPDLRVLAREHAGDVYEKGTLEFSILLAFLNTVQP
jgi:hypothetical protein